MVWFVFFFFFKQKTAYEMRISDWSSDVCSSDLKRLRRARRERGLGRGVNPRDDLVRGKSLLFVGEATTKRDADTVDGAKDQLRKSGVTVVFYSAPAGKVRRR